MPLVKTSYETTAGSSLPQGKLAVELKGALITSELSQHQFNVSAIDDYKLVFVAGMDSRESAIPPFVHPYLVEGFKGKNYLIADIRPFRNSTDPWLSEKNFEDSVKNKAEYLLTKNRAIMELKWVAGQQAKLKTKFKFAATMFAAWVNQAVTKIYGLDFQDQKTIMAISLYYYHSLFTADKHLQDKNLDVAVIHTIKATKLQPGEVKLIFDQMPEINGIESLCEAIKTLPGNVRLENFNLPTLLSILANTWYGNNARDMIAVALEYPPVWISIIAAAITERTYRSSPIARLVEGQAKNSEMGEFKLNYLDEVQIQTFAVEAIDNDNVVFRDF